MSQSENRLSFNKGYTENGFVERVFHLHLRYVGDKLKLRLWKKYEHNRDAYTNAKTEFVKGYTEKAKILYWTRY